MTRAAAAAPVTMQSLANTSARLAEALDWARAGVALFRQVGDHLYAANTLFIMAQRSMYAGFTDDEVHQWLTKSQALADATYGEGERLPPAQALRTASSGHCDNRVCR